MCVNVRVSVDVGVSVVVSMSVSGHAGRDARTGCVRRVVLASWLAELAG